MPLPKFKYLAPKTVDEACSLLSKYKGKAKVLAGGTDLLVKMRQYKETPQYLVSLNRIGSLKYIDADHGDILRIGALTSISDLLASPMVTEKFDILSQAARVVAFQQIRNRGTIGGNLCNASPAADTVAPLLSLGSRVTVASVAGERVVPLEEFFRGPGQTVLQSDEILTEIQVPYPPPGSGGVYLKLAPREKDLATVAVATVIVLDSAKTACVDARIALAAVAPTIFRSRQAETVVTGKSIDISLIDRAAQAAAAEAQPISDVRASAEYRRDMVKVLVKRAMTQALAAAKSS